MRIKRLTLDWWVKKEIKEESKRWLKKTQPIFYKEGIFKSGKKCWFEVLKNNKFLSFEYDLEMFKFLLECEFAKELNKEQQEGLKAIVKAKMSTRYQESMYNRLIHIEEVKEFERNIKKRKLSILLNAS